MDFYQLSTFVKFKFAADYFFFFEKVSGDILQKKNQELEKMHSEPQKAQIFRIFAINFLTIKRYILFHFLFKDI